MGKISRCSRHQILVEHFRGWTTGTNWDAQGFALDLLEIFAQWWKRAFILWPNDPIKRARYRFRLARYRLQRQTPRHLFPFGNSQHDTWKFGIGRACFTWNTLAKNFLKKALTSWNFWRACASSRVTKRNCVARVKIWESVNFTLVSYDFLAHWIGAGAPIIVQFRNDVKSFLDLSQK